MINAISRRPGNVLLPSTTARYRAIVGIGALFALALLLLSGPVSNSLASEHTEITGEYGKEGAKSTGVGNGCRIAFNSAAGNLYLYSDGKIYGLSVSPGTATPLGGNFPFTTSSGTGCGDPDMEVDNSGSGNLFGVQSGGQVFGWNSSGTALGAPWPVSTGGGETCGVDVSPTGEAWGGNYSQHKILKYTAAGASNGSIDVGFSFCKFAVNHANGDVFVAPYNSGEIVKFTAASGYTTKVNFPASGTNNPGLYVNAAENKLYVGNNSTSIKAYDTETAALVETITLPGSGGQGLAVDEATDTLFATIGFGASGYIVEYLGITVPKATTGEPTGNSSVSGTADPNGVGPITECYFEYGLTTSYGSSQPCAESVPFNTEQAVSANFPGLIGEETYHYRLVLGNGEPHVIGKGGDKTIVPHNVKGLTTEPATEITSDSALLNATFEGDGEETHYYFEWGQTTNYGHKTATPPGDSAGSPTGITTVSTLLPNLDQGTTYHYRVIGENPTGISGAKDKSFTTYEVPSIDSATTSHLTASSADVDITINPHEFETTYFIEYGTSTDYGSIAPVPSGTIAPANTAQPVTVSLTGLAGVPYHFRVLAENEWGQVVTEDQSFNFYPQNCPNSTLRQQNESQYLPDCRAFELVTPEETGNIEIYNVGSTPNTYASNPPRFAFGGGLGGLKGTEPVNSGGDTYIATRTTTGWKSKLTGFRGFESQGGGTLFGNSDLSKFLSFDEEAFFAGEPQPPHRVPYLFDGEGNILERWPTNFESIPGAEGSIGAYQQSPDLTHMALTSTNVAFTPDGLTSGIGSAYDYNAVTETMSLISLDEEGNPIQSEPGATPSQPLGIFFPVPGTRQYPTGGSIAFYGNGSNDPQGQRPDPINPPVSTDGSHILMATSSASYEYFTNPRPPVRLYMSVDRGDHYDHYEVSKKKYVVYLGMTPDGSKVFFTSPEQLTADDTDTSIDLYMWSDATNELTLLSKGAPLAEGTGNSDNCNANYVAKCGIFPVYTKENSDTTISENGEIYFYSPEQLDGTKGVPNRENLFIYRGGKPQFVASFDPTPAGEQTTGPVSRFQVGGNGDRAAMITKTRLTGYDNAGKEEMYTYSAVTRKIVCVSCRPDGDPPGFNVEGSKAGRFMSDDGRAFFSTSDALIPVDSNEALDVYEYSEGRPQLITTGSGTTESGAGSYGGGRALPGAVGLAGVSADGVDVYFATLDVLVPQNHNGPFVAFYDARTNGGFPYVPPLAPCEAADECHGAGNAPPARPTVASEGDLGSRGNAPNPTKKKHKSKRRRKAKHRRHHKRHHRPASRGGARHHRQGGN